MPPLVHHPAYDARSVPDGHRFPMRKYSLVAEMLRAAGHTFHTPSPASAETLVRAHLPDYVDAVLQARLERSASRRIGFEVTPAVAERARASVGGTCEAARLALDHGAAVNLAGGSHHAAREAGAGFCVFNDVAVAALELLETGAAARIAVLDLDVHHGDGTARILAGRPDVFTCSLHCEANWPRDKPPGDLDIALPEGMEDDAYLRALEPALEAIAGFAPDLVFYNAGVDPHRDDRLGKLALSDAGLYRRDRRVAQACAARGLAVCGVLGGGYSHDARAVAGRHLLLVEAMAQIA